MDIQEIQAAVKRATVAIVLEFPGKIPARPFTIVGSGFCIHPEGVVVTCGHVFRSFVDPASYQRVMAAVKDGDRQPFPELAAARPHALFLGDVRGTEIIMFPVPIVNATTKTNYDLAVFKLHKHGAFANGYPTLAIANYDELHEMMEIGICGFPLGEVLHEQLGTVTSSFTKGMISSIIPAPGVAREHVKGFQLDATATNGNSGGPVFSLATGKVFGVLQGGAMHPGGYPIGLTKAEPVYPVFEHDLVARMAVGIPLPSGSPVRQMRDGTLTAPSRFP
jgi:S1-C subfamily serine protease